MRKIFLALCIGSILFACDNPDNRPDNGQPEHFEISVSGERATGATVSITPTEEVENKWIWEVELSNVAVNEEYVIKFLDDSYYSALNQFGYNEVEYPYEQFCEEFLIPAGVNDEWDYTDLKPETEYTVWACEVDEWGDVLSEIETYTFRTTAVQMSDMTFEIEVDDKNNLTITPSNNREQYIYIYGDEQYLMEEFGTTDPAAVLTDLAKWVTEFGADLYRGEWTENINLKSIREGKNYVWVAGFDGVLNTEVFTFEFDFKYWTPPVNTLTGNVSGVVFTSVDAYEISGRRELENLDLLEMYFYSDNGHMMRMYLYAEDGASDFSGTYKVGPEQVPFTVQPGFINESDYLDGSHYFLGYSYEQYALITSGEVTITKNGNNYNIAINTASDNKKIEASYNGTIELQYID